MDIPEDIRCYQDTLIYASSKVDYRMGENIYMLPSDMNLNIRSGTARYNNKILVSDGKFSLGKNDKVNALELTAMKNTAGYNNKILVTHSKNDKVNALKHAVKGYRTFNYHSGVSTKTSYYSRRGKSCFNSLSHWRLYYVVYVLINGTVKPAGGNHVCLNK